MRVAMVGDRVSFEDCGQVLIGEVSNVFLYDDPSNYHISVTARVYRPSEKTPKENWMRCREFILKCNEFEFVECGDDHEVK